VRDDVQAEVLTYFREYPNERGRMAYDNVKGIEWEWQAMDGAMTQAPLGGEGTRPNPTDRSTSGTKRSGLTDGQGVPLGVAVNGANRNDVKRVRATLEAQAAERQAHQEETTAYVLGQRL